MAAGALPHPSRVPVLRAVRLLPDAAVARRAATGDAAAFAEIYRRYGDLIQRYCRSLLAVPADAEDALQATMAAALRSLPGETRSIELKAWLFRVAHNHCIDVLRARRETASVDELAGIAASASVAQDAATRARLRELVGDLQALPERQRSALVMRELSGLEFAEIASALETTPATVKQAVYEARVALQEIAEGRAMSCESVQKMISDGDRRTRKGRKVRSHLRGCDGCSAFAAAIDARSADLALLAPPLAAGGIAGLLGGIFGGGLGAGSGAAGKAVAVVAATAAVGAGGYGSVVAVEETREAPAAPARVAAPTRDDVAQAGAAVRVPAGERAASPRPRPVGERAETPEHRRRRGADTRRRPSAPDDVRRQVPSPAASRPQTAGRPEQHASSPAISRPAPAAGAPARERPGASPQPTAPAQRPAAPPVPSVVPTTVPTVVPTAAAGPPENVPAPVPAERPDLSGTRPF